MKSNLSSISARHSSDSSLLFNFFCDLTKVDLCDWRDNNLEKANFMIEELLANLKKKKIGEYISDYIDLYIRPIKIWRTVVNKGA